MSPLVLWDEVTATWAEPGAGSTPPVGTAPVITTAALGPFTVGVPVNVVIEYTGSAATSAAVIGTALQAGLSLVLTAGVARITGTPSAASTRTSTIRLTNAYGSGERAYTITVAAAGVAPSIMTTTLGPIVSGVAVDTVIEYTGNVATSASVSAGELPAGLSFGLTAGVARVTGTTTDVGPYDCTLRLANSFGAGTRALSGTVTSTVTLIPAVDLDESNTGYQTWMGPLTTRADGSITTAGTVFQNWNVNGPIYVNAPNVIIRRCVFNAHAWGIEVGPNATNLIVEDCTFIGGENCGIMDDGYAANVTYRRLNIKQGEDGMKLSGNGRTLQNVYIHDLRPRAGNPDPHHDGIQCYSGSNWTFDACRIESHDTSCIAMFAGQMTASNVTIQNCYLTGSTPGPAYAIYAPGAGTNIKVLNNIFGLWLYGPVTDWLYSGTGWEWSGNTRFGTGAPVNL